MDAKTIKQLLSAYYRLKEDKGMNAWAEETKNILLNYYSENNLESGKASELKPTTQIDGVPHGFVKMDLELTFINELIDVWEKKILYFLVRDYYIFYTKIPKFDGTKFTEIHFYCRPQDESSIVYRMGNYFQAALKSYGEDYFENAIHTVPDDFPNCIHIELKKELTV